MVKKKIQKKFGQNLDQHFEENYADEDIILYAWFSKKILFKYPFTRRPPMVFKEEKVPAFEATSLNQKSQVLVHYYESRHNFVVSLRTQSPKEEVYLLKSKGTFYIDEVVKHVQ